MFRKTINTRLAKAIIWIIKGYQYTLSPDKGLPSFWLKGRVCMHTPHCSQYSINVLKRYGFRPGIFYATDRVLHCTGGMNKIYDPDRYKVVFFSSAPIGVPFLQALYEDPRYEVVGVVTQCDKPAGRGMQMCECIIKQEAKKLHHPTLSTQYSTFITTPSKINPEKSEEGRSFSEWLKSKDADFFVVIAYGKIIPQSILDIAKIAPINIHGSLLPEYRGASPIQSVLLDEKKETGITIIKMNAGMDTGNMIDKVKFKIPFERTCKDIIEKMQDIGPKFLGDSLRKYGKKILGEVVQSEDEATYCEKIEKESGLIEPQTTPLHEIYAKYRGFYLWPKVYFMHQNKRVIIENLKIEETLYEENKDTPLLTTTKINNAVTKIQVKPEGKKTMERKEFLNGYLK